MAWILKLLDSSNPKNGATLGAVAVVLTSLFLAAAKGLIVLIKFLLKKLPTESKPDGHTAPKEPVSQSPLVIVIYKCFSFAAIIAFMEVVGFLTSVVFVVYSIFALKEAHQSFTTTGICIVAELVCFMFISAIFMYWWKKKAL